MANICFNDITMVGDKTILQRLRDDIERYLDENDGSIYRYGNELYPVGGYKESERNSRILLPAGAIRRQEVP